jgi:hypothetical protein
MTARVALAGATMVTSIPVVGSMAMTRRLFPTRLNSSGISGRLTFSGENLSATFKPLGF